MENNVNLKPAKSAVSWCWSRLHQRLS